MMNLVECEQQAPAWLLCQRHERLLATSTVSDVILPTAVVNIQLHGVDHLIIQIAQVLRL